MSVKKIIKFSKKNWFLIIFFVAIGFVGIVAFQKLFLTKPTFIYVKVKVGQGLWWATTAKPSSWFVNALKKGDKEYDLFGRPNAEILSLRYYPTWGSDAFDVYLTLKLKARFNKSTKGYIFKRTDLSVGSPIELQFPSANITGTIIEIDQKPFDKKYVEKIIYLVNRGGYSKDFPYLFDTIKVGERYYDGEEYVFEVLDKRLEKNIWSVTNNFTGQVFERDVYTTQNIIVKAKVRVRERKDYLIYGNTYYLKVNSYIPFSTESFIFNDFVVRSIES